MSPKKSEKPRKMGLLMQFLQKFPNPALLSKPRLFPLCLDRLFYKIWRWHQHRLMKARQEMDRQRPVSEDDRVAILKYVENIRTGHQEDQRGLAAISDQQRIRISQLEQKLVDIEKENTPAPTPSPDEKADNSTLSEPITLDNLIKYVVTKFPKKNAGEELLSRVIDDIDKTRFTTMADIDQAVVDALPFVNAYENRQPKLFMKGADYITKSLGFSDEYFMRKHAFSEATKKAIQSFKQSPSKSSAKGPRFALPVEAEKIDVSALTFQELGENLITLAQAINNEVKAWRGSHLNDTQKVNAFILNYMPKIAWLYGEARGRGLRDDYLEKLVTNPRSALFSESNVYESATRLENFGSDLKIRSY